MAALGVLLAPAVARATAPTFVQGTVADYAGIAVAGALDQIISARGQGTTVDTGATAAVGAGELVFAALLTGGAPGSVTPGSSAGVPYTPRAQTSNGSPLDEDLTSSAAGAQQGTATLGAADGWYAVCAVFHPVPSTPPVPPSAPAGLHATSVASTRAALSWSPSSGSVAGYTVYRNGSAIATTGPDTTTFLDPNVTRATTYAYAVDAFDLANDHSARSAALSVTTPALSPEFVQGAAASPADRLASYTYTLSKPVLAGDLLIGWFGQYNAPGQVQVSDNINGRWKQPDGPVPHRRPERQRLLRPGRHPVQRRRPAGGEPDLGLGHQLVHGACHLPSPGDGRSPPRGASARSVAHRGRKTRKY